MNDMTLNKLTMNQSVIYGSKQLSQNFLSPAAYALYYDIMTTVPAVIVKLMEVIVAS
jgi:hypothetical protein